jgi:hypothetical protein
MHTKDYLDKEPYEFVEVLEATPLQELLAPARHAHINEWQIPDRGVCHDRVHAAGVNFLLYTEDFERWECVVDTKLHKITIKRIKNVYGPCS